MSIKLKKTPPITKAQDRQESSCSWSFPHWRTCLRLSSSSGESLQMLCLFEKFWAEKDKFIVVYHWLCLPGIFWYPCQCRRHSQRWILYSAKGKKSVVDTFWTKILLETNSIWFSMKLRYLPLKSKPNLGDLIDRQKVYFDLPWAGFPLEEGSWFLARRVGQILDLNASPLYLYLYYCIF